MALQHGVSLQVTAASNAGQVQATMREFERQLPFAASVALTRLARESRDQERDRLEEVFTIRRQRVRTGLTMIRAEKRDWPHTKAHVGHRDEFMVDHETGATRRSKRGGSLAIPTRLVRRTKRGKIRKSQRPRAILAGPKGYIAEHEIRVRQKGRRGPSRRLTVAYLLRRRAEIAPRWGFRDSVEARARARYDDHFRVEMEAAIASAKRKTKISSAGGRKAYLRARGAAGRSSGIMPRSLSSAARAGLF